jgi:DUF1680 family protein
MGSKVHLDWEGRNIEMTQRTDYPWDGKVNLSLSLDQPAEFTVALRVPGWSKEAKVSVNGVELDVTASTSKGYAKIRRLWQNGDQIELVLDMPVEIVRSNPNVRENAGKIALQRGPVVFCLEEADNGSNLRDIVLPANSKLSVHFEEDLFGGVAVITGTGWRSDAQSCDDALYMTAELKKVPAAIKAIPYFAWSNRQPGEMLVWIREH